MQKLKKVLYRARDFSHENVCEIQKESEAQDLSKLKFALQTEGSILKIYFTTMKEQKRVLVQNAMSEFQRKMKNIPKEKQTKFKETKNLFQSVDHICHDDNLFYGYTYFPSYSLWQKGYESLFPLIVPIVSTKGKNYGVLIPTTH